MAMETRTALRCTDASLIGIDKALAAASLAEFVKMAWHVLEPSTELKWGWAVDAICEHLEAITSGDIRNLLANVPPGSMKSLLVGVFWPAWEWGPKGLQHYRYLGTSHSRSLAVRDNLKCRRLVQSQWYQARWPVSLTGDQNAKTKFENDKTGFRECMSFTGMTGSRGDRVLLDDPISAYDANSEAELYKAKIEFTETLPTRINNDRSSIIVIMQRLHERDTSGLILDMGLDYEHLIIPMRYEPDRKCVTGIGWEDPRKAEGELMFPDRFSETQVSDLEATMGAYGSAGQLQQRPVPRGGGMFKREWFEVVQAAPVSTQWMRGWDLAGSKGQGSDYTAGVLMGRRPDGGYIVADSKRFRGSPGEVERTLKNTAASDVAQYNSRNGSIPQDPGQAGKAQAQYLIKALSGFAYRATPESGDKQTRAAPFAAQAEAGNVSILAGDWNREYLDELASFPYGSFDDQVDASSRAFNMLSQPKQIGMLPKRGNKK